MAQEQFANNSISTLASAINGSQTSLVVSSASTFPLVPQFRLKCGDELMLVTGVAGTTFTVTRGIEGTLAVAHPQFATVFSPLTAGALQNLAVSASAQVLYASAEGIVLDSDVISGGGTDQTSALQTLLDRATSGPVELVMDGAALISGLSVHSNTTIRCLTKSCGFYLATGSDMAVLTNANPIDSGSVTDKNIALTGGTYNGNGAPLGVSDGTTFNQIKSSATLGWVVSTGIGLYGVSDVLIDNVTILNARSFATQFANAHYLTVRNSRILFTAPNLNSNNDGLHLNGHSDFVLFEGNYLNTFDDAIGINADEPTIPGYDRVDVAPYVNNGPIHDVICRDTFFDGCDFGVRILSISSRIDNILVDGMSGTISGHFANLDFFYPVSQATHGDVGKVTFANVNVVCNGTSGHAGAAAAVLYCGAFVNYNIESLSFINCLRTQWPDNRPYIRMSPHAHIGTLRISGYNCRDTNLTGGAQVLCCGDCDLLIASDVVVQRPGASSSTDTSFVYVDPVNNSIDGAGASSQGFARVMIDGIYEEYSPCVVHNVSGLIGAIQMQKVRCEAAGASPSPIFLEVGTTSDIYLGNYFGPSSPVVLGGSAAAPSQRGDGFTSNGPYTTVLFQDTFGTSASLDNYIFTSSDASHCSVASNTLSFSDGTNAGVLEVASAPLSSTPYAMPTNATFSVVFDTVDQGIRINISGAGHDTYITLYWTASGVVQAFTVVSGSVTATDTGPTLSGGSPHTFRAVITGGTSATLFVDNTQVGLAHTITAGLPFGIAFNTGGTHHAKNVLLTS